MQSLCSHISDTVEKSFDFALELFSKHVLSGSQMDCFNEDELGRDGTDQQKKIQNYKILRKVQGNIAKEPEKFDTLCAVLDALNYNSCSLKLKGKIIIIPAC